MGVKAGYLFSHFFTLYRIIRLSVGIHLLNNAIKLTTYTY